MEKFKVKCIVIPNGISNKTGNKKDVSMFNIDMILTVVDIDKQGDNEYYTFKEVNGCSILGDVYNSKYFEKV